MTKEIDRYLSAMWIETKDFLPDEPGMRIVFVPTLDKDKPFIGVAWFEPEGTGNLYGWQLLPAVFCQNVTHWMPMPENPKNDY